MTANAALVAELEAERLAASDHDRRRPPVDYLAMHVADTVRALAEAMGYTPRTGPGRTEVTSCRP